MRHVGKVLGVLGAVGAGSAAVAHVVRKRAHRADTEKQVDEAFAALPRLATKNGLAAYDSSGGDLKASNDNAAPLDRKIVAVDRQMARRAHAHVVRGVSENRKNADPFSEAYAAKFGDTQAPTRVEMSPVAAAMVNEADQYVDEFLDDDVMVIDDSMLDDMMVGDATYDDSMIDEAMFDDEDDFSRMHDDEAITPGGTMFVGAVDEVELSGPFRTGSDPLAFDPEEVPSEHDEINQLRMKMPFG